MPLSDIVDITISRETASLAQETFDIIAVMSREVNSHYPVEYISSSSEAREKLHGGIGGETYRVVQSIFSQNPRPKTIALIPIKSIAVFYYSGTILDGDSIIMTVNGTEYIEDFETDADTTLDNLASAINTAFGDTVAVNNSDGLFTIDTGSGTDYLSASVNLSGILTGSFLMDEGKNLDISFSNDSWSADGSVVFKINGTTVSVGFSTSVDNTMSVAVKAALEAAYPDVIADVVWDAQANRLSLIQKKDSELFLQSVTFSGITGTMAFSSAQRRNDDESVTAILGAVQAYDNSFYGLVYVPYNVDTTEIANIKLISDWVEANKKIFAISTDETNSVNLSVSADTASLAYYVKSKGYVRSFASYSPYASASSGFYEAPGAAVLGKVFPWTPGSYTCKFLNLAGVTVESLTATQVINADAKNLNTYISMGGRGMYQQGTVGAGEFIDVIIFIDWLHSQIQTNVFSALINNKKVPFDDTGLGLLGGKVMAALEAGIKSGGMTEHLKDEDGNIIGGYVVYIPKASEVLDNDKASRKLSNANPIRFTAFISGAIHALKIEGKVTV